jgi:hypothetical protein
LAAVQRQRADIEGTTIVNQTAICNLPNIITG